MENIVPACRFCNSQKSDRTPLEWIAAQAGLIRGRVSGKGVRVVEQPPIPRPAVLLGYPREIPVNVVRETAHTYRFVALETVLLRPLRLLRPSRESYTAKANIRFTDGAA